jgi:hypothetical protein
MQQGLPTTSIRERRASQAAPRVKSQFTLRAADPSASGTSLDRTLAKEGAVDIADTLQQDGGPVGQGNQGILTAVDLGRMRQRVGDGVRRQVDAIATRLAEPRDGIGIDTRRVVECFGANTTHPNQDLALACGDRVAGATPNRFAASASRDRLAAGRSIDKLRPRTTDDRIELRTAETNRAAPGETEMVKPARRARARNTAHRVASAPTLPLIA